MHITDQPQYCAPLTALMLSLYHNYYTLRLVQIIININCWLFRRKKIRPISNTSLLLSIYMYTLRILGNLTDGKSPLRRRSHSRATYVIMMQSQQ